MGFFPGNMGRISQKYTALGEGVPGAEMSPPSVLVCPLRTMALAVFANFQDKLSPDQIVCPGRVRMHVGYAFIGAVLEVTYAILDFYVWALIIGAVMSWLVAFGIINPRNRLVQVVGDFLYRITEPALRPIRRLLPPMGGMDLSPLVLIFIIMFLQSFLRRLVL